jgi:hypothetical protein
LHERDLTGGGRMSNRDAVAFIQEWLWFGMLSEFLEADFNIEQFVCRESPDHPTVNTTWLPYILTDWCRKTDQLSPSEQRDRFARILALFY